MGTYTVYPDGGSGTTTVDGIVQRSGTTDAFSTVRDGAGTFANVTATNQTAPFLVSSTISNQFTTINRGIFTFDTSALNNLNSVLSAFFSVFGASISTGLGNDEFHVVSSTPASNNNLVTSDYSQLGTTSFGNIVGGSWITTGYNDVALNASGLSNLVLTGISKFGARGVWDLNNSFTGVWASSVGSGFSYNFADFAGTSADPKLTITFSGALPNLSNIGQLNFPRHPLRGQ